jgi:DNA-binding transcriptional MerR regulator
VSVRTLHFYDEIGLLKPAYIEANGYRYYEEKQLLLLQQILFFRELGFELKQIQKILGKGDFDKVAALHSHRKVLQTNIERTKKLIKTIDKTITHLSGEKKMKDPEIYHGFSKEKQEEYEKQIIERFGEQGKVHTEECRQNVKKWSKPDWDRSKKEFAEICTELAGMMKKNLSADSKEVQNVIRRHYQWLKQFWTPTRESYPGHGKFIADSELGEAYKVYHPQMPEFIAAAIQVFADQEMTQ